MGYFQDRKRFIAAANLYDNMNDDLPCGCSPGMCDCYAEEDDGIDPGYDGILGEG